LIRNLFIIYNGVPLVTKNFGKCQKLGNDEYLVSGFIGALHSFSKEVVKSAIKSISFDEYNFHFYKDIKIENLLYILVCDQDDDKDTIKFKIEKIAELFNQNYDDEITRFKGDIEVFDKFSNILIEMNIAQKNCGGRPECEGCPNSEKTSKIINAFKENPKSFFQKIKSFFKRKQN